jgi:hypothetical protein
MEAEAGVNELATVEESEERWCWARKRSEEGVVDDGSGISASALGAAENGGCGRGGSLDGVVAVVGVVGTVAETGGVLGGVTVATTPVAASHLPLLRVLNSTVCSSVRLWYDTTLPQKRIRSPSPSPLLLPPP